MTNPIVTIEMEDGGEIQIELYAETAPNTVRNFVSLVSKGFYNGTTFHRVIPGFMIQGGDPEGNGMGGPGYTIAGEFAMNGFHNDLKHTRGVLSMARAMDPNSAGSQFFIMVEDAPHLDNQYAAFGRVITGMDVCDRIVATRTNFRDMPLKPQVMKSVPSRPLAKALMSRRRFDRTVSDKLKTALRARSFSVGHKEDYDNGGQDFWQTSVSKD